MLVGSTAYLYNIIGFARTLRTDYLAKCPNSSHEIQLSPGVNWGQRTVLEVSQPPQKQNRCSNWQMVAVLIPLVRMSRSSGQPIESCGANFVSCIVLVITKVLLDCTSIWLQNG